MSDYRVLPITAEKGLLGHIEDSMMPPGFAANIHNWRPDASGSLKPRVGWLKASTTNAPSTRVSRGIGYHAQQGVYEVPTLVQSVFNSSTTGASVTATWPAPTTIGNTLIAVIFKTVNSISTNARPSGYSMISAAASDDLYIDGCVNSTTSHSGTETWTVGTTMYWGIYLMEWSNVTAAHINTLSGAGFTSSTTATFTSLTTNTSPSPVLAMVLTYSNSTAANSSVGLQPSPPYTNILDKQDWNDKWSGAVDWRQHDDSDTTPSSVTVTHNGVTARWATVALAMDAKPKTTTTFDISYLQANADAGDYDIYAIDGNSIDSASWSIVDSVTPASAIISDPVAFTMGLASTFYTSHRFATVRKWNPIAGSSAVSGSPAGRCIAFHKNRLFVGGTLLNPYRLYYSNISDYATWGVNSYIDIGRDDGEPIEDITPFRNALMIGKKSSLWFLTGSGPDTFSLSKLPVGGAAPGRSLMPTPYGVVCAGARNVWLADGNGDVQLISRPISDTYNIGTYASTSFIDDTVYVCDADTGSVWVMDMATGAWFTEGFDSAGEAPAALYNYDYTQLMAPRNATVGSLLSYRYIPGSSKAKDFDTLTETYTHWTPEIWPVGPGTKITPRHLMLKVRQRGGTAAQTGITVYTYANGDEVLRTTVGPYAEAGVYRERLDVGGASGIDYVQFRLEQTVPSGHASLFDIEEMMLGYDAEPKR